MPNTQSDNTSSDVGNLIVPTTTNNTLQPILENGNQPGLFTPNSGYHDSISNSLLHPNYTLNGTNNNNNNNPLNNTNNNNNGLSNTSQNGLPRNTSNNSLTNNQSPFNPSTRTSGFLPQPQLAPAGSVFFYHNTTNPANTTTNNNNAPNGFNNGNNTGPSLVAQSFVSQSSILGANVNNNNNTHNNNNPTINYGGDFLSPPHPTSFSSLMAHGTSAIIRSGGTPQQLGTSINNNNNLGNLPLEQPPLQINSSLNTLTHQYNITHTATLPTSNSHVMPFGSTHAQHAGTMNFSTHNTNSFLHGQQSPLRDSFTARQSGHLPTGLSNNQHLLVNKTYTTVLGGSTYLTDANLAPTSATTTTTTGAATTRYNTNLNDPITSYPANITAFSPAAIALNTPTVNPLLPPPTRKLDSHLSNTPSITKPQIESQQQHQHHLHQAPIPRSTGGGKVGPSGLAGPPVYPTDNDPNNNSVGTPLGDIDETLPQQDHHQQQQLLQQQQHHHTPIQPTNMGTLPSVMVTPGNVPYYGNYAYNQPHLTSSLANSGFADNTNNNNNNSSTTINNNERTNPTTTTSTTSNTANSASNLPPTQFPTPYIRDSMLALYQNLEIASHSNKDLAGGTRPPRSRPLLHKHIDSDGQSIDHPRVHAVPQYMKAVAQVPNHPVLLSVHSTIPGDNQTFGPQPDVLAMNFGTKTAPVSSDQLDSIDFNGTMYTADGQLRQYMYPMQFYGNLPQEEQGEASEAAIAPYLGGEGKVRYAAIPYTSEQKAQRAAQFAMHRHEILTGADAQKQDEDRSRTQEGRPRRGGRFVRVRKPTQKSTTGNARTKKGQAAANAEAEQQQQEQEQQQQQQQQNDASAITTTTTDTAPVLSQNITYGDPAYDRLDNTKYQYGQRPGLGGGNDGQEYVQLPPPQ